MPVSNPVPSFWNAEPLPFDDLRSTEDVPSEADIVIIGAGFSGIASLPSLACIRSVLQAVCEVSHGWYSKPASGISSSQPFARY
jgi:cation diffusion facilitator CzcD-associated flavoprotein CzcO